MTESGTARTLECDLLVVGSGAAGLSGAVTAAYHGLDVVVAEKAPVLGGATSWSGGWMWAPLNPLSQADGIIEDVDGQPVPGLYVAGSDQANVMGGHYPSGGINIGPAMTFGYIAGRHAAGVTEYENVVPVPLNDGN